MFSCENTCIKILKNEGELMSRMTRRNLLRASSAGALGAAGAVALAACGETVRTVTQEVPVEKIVIKEVPVDKIVQKTQIKEVPVEKIVEKTKVEKQVVEKVVTRIVKEMVPQKQAVRLEFSTDWSKGVRAETHKFMAKEYNKANPHVTVDILIISGSGGSTSVGYAGVLTNMMVAGSGPEVMSELWWNADLYNLDLEPHMKSAGMAPNDFWWHDGYLVDKNGAIKGVPYGVYTGCQCANLSLVDKFGVTLPGNDYEWNEFSDLAKKMRDPEGDIWGLDGQAGNAWNQGYGERFASEGALWYDTATEKSTAHIGDANGVTSGGKPVEAFTDLWNLIWKDNVAPNSDQAAATLSSPANTTGEGNLFRTGLMGMSGTGFNSLGSLKSRIGGRFEFHVFMPPKSPYTGIRGYHNETNNIAVNKVAEERGNAEEAAGLALFWHQDTMANYLAEYQPVVPAIKSVWGSDKISGITSGADVFPTLAAEAEKVGNFRENWVRGTYAHENWLEWFRVMRAKLGDRAMKGGEDPVKMMAELEKDGTAALQREI